ncbi:Rieske 2Fe-2S domain-containing protein [Thalassoglobus sp.]|uniref:Rieske 2Fe-2S domain-containing protein n=1 Tax=Thalassoglobus sp. TaxID=2795869 RepID=UPI003AA7CDB4
MANPIEVWKADKHPLDVWSDVERYADAQTKMSDVESADLERMKWHGFFYRKRDKPGRYMNRIRVTANELTAAQAREIALMAYEYGHGIVDVTTRANLQIQGLEISHLPDVKKRLERVGLNSKQTGHDNIRNVFGHPFSGLLTEEIIDTRQLCKDVDAIYIDSRDYSDLPRKLNICFSGTEDHPAHYWTQDLSFMATRDDEGEVGFQVLLGGTQGQNPRLAWHLPVFLYPDQVVPLTEAIIQLFRDKGTREKRNKARLRFLIEEIGIAGVIDWLEEKLPFRMQPSISEPIPTAVPEEFVGWIRQSNPKLWTMGLSVPLGRMTWKQLEGLSLLSKKWGDGQLRTTQEQGIAVINIPNGFRGAAATDAAALGLSVHADEFELNTMACTGSQFCNIAVTETKGHMFQLIEKLRKRALKLHGIRIHMSGCPSSCAQHFTADIGLKGVRVRRLVGTKEGFDLFLGGGLAGQVHMGLPYRLGVDVDQLPNVIEEVTDEYYLRHKPGQTFSSFWRERLQAAEAAKVGDDDYVVPTWICEGCEHEHQGEDPPVFCPSCAGLRRLFARIEYESDSQDQPDSKDSEQPAVRDDGFVFAAKMEDIPEKNGLTVQVQGHEYALFRHEGGIRCIDSACPHEGASLADGEFKDGVVSCPWHDWTFNVCSGCSLEPVGHAVTTYESLIEDERVYILPSVEGSASELAPQANSTADILAAARAGATTGASRKAVRPVEATLCIKEIVQETPDVKTFRLDNSEGKIPFDFPGKFAKVCQRVDGEDVWRSFTISSSPSKPETLDLTIKLNPTGQLTQEMFSSLQPGSELRLKGAQGAYFFDPDNHSQPLVLISAGSGITPMMSISRLIRDSNLNRPVTFLFGARTSADIIFHQECQELQEQTDWFRYFVTLSQPDQSWPGAAGRLDMKYVQEHVSDIKGSRYFLCGPNEFMDALRAQLVSQGVDGSHIHTEQFNKSPKAVTV